MFARTHSARLVAAQCWAANRNDTLSDSYESSRVLLAKPAFDGTLQLLTSAWERMLGYAREELMIYIVAEETPAERVSERLSMSGAGEERRAHARPT